MPPKGEILYRAFPLNLDSLQSPPLIDRFFNIFFVYKDIVLKGGRRSIPKPNYFRFQVKFILVRRKRVKVKMSKIWVKHTTFVV